MLRVIIVAVIVGAVVGVGAGVLVHTVPFFHDTLPKDLHGAIIGGVAGLMGVVAAQMTRKKG